MKNLAHLATSLISGCALFLISGCASGPQIDKEYFPVSEGIYWTYKVETSGNKFAPAVQEITIRLGKKVKLPTEEFGRGSGAEGWQMYRNDKLAKAFVILEAGSYRIVEEGGVGFAGVPALITVSEVQWKAEDWSYAVASGCIIDSVDGHQEGFLNMETPMGNQKCAVISLTGPGKDNKARLSFGKELGLVQQIIQRPNGNGKFITEKWTLVDMHPSLKKAPK